MGTEEQATEPEIDVMLHDGYAEVAPFVWYWDGERWDGPEGTGDYPPADS